MTDYTDLIADLRAGHVVPNITSADAIEALQRENARLEQQGMIPDSVMGGYRPDDRLQRILCKNAGTAGHMQCGWCSECDVPRYACGCTYISAKETDADFAVVDPHDNAHCRGWGLSTLQQMQADCLVPMSPLANQPDGKPGFT